MVEMHFRSVKDSQDWDWRQDLWCAWDKWRFFNLHKKSLICCIVINGKSNPTFCSILSVPVSVYPCCLKYCRALWLPPIIMSLSWSSVHVSNVVDLRIRRNKLPSRSVIDKDKARKNVTSNFQVSKLSHPLGSTQLHVDAPSLRRLDEREWAKRGEITIVDRLGQGAYMITHHHEFVCPE